MSHAGQEDRSRDYLVRRTTTDFDDDVGLSTRLLLTLEAVPGYDLEDGDTVVFDHVDLEALDDLFRPMEGTSQDGHVRFTVDDFAITATADGEITVRTDRSTDARSGPSR